MYRPKFLIDTNILFHLEDQKIVDPILAVFMKLTTKHSLGVFVHEASRDDINRDKDIKRRAVSLSKLNKFQTINKVRNLTLTELERHFGPLSKPNDETDATLLHALSIHAADFLITEDRKLHDRAKKHSEALAARVLYISDAKQLVATAFEQELIPVKNIQEVTANSILVTDPIFNTLRTTYIDFDLWWAKCVKDHRPCWIVEDNGIAGIIVRKDESSTETDATFKAEKILKICTFKVREENRGEKIGELLLKKAFWHAQRNSYDLIYLTVYEEQISLIELLEYFGFIFTTKNSAGERIYEKRFSTTALFYENGEDPFFLHRTNYPRFVFNNNTEGFGVPIVEDYHDILFPDLRQDPQFNLFNATDGSRPGNTIRKVYLCHAKSNLGKPGSILFFYKGKSNLLPSQALTAVGILEDVTLAKSTSQLVQLTNRRSVFSQKELISFSADTKPVKVINFFLCAYIEPPINISELIATGVFNNSPPQSIFRITNQLIETLLKRINFGFSPT